MASIKIEIKDTLFSVIDVKMSDFVVTVNVAILMLIVLSKFQQKNIWC